MSEQEMIDGAIAAHESGQWGEWLKWLDERGVRLVEQVSSTPDPTWTAELDGDASSNWIIWTPPQFTATSIAQ